LTVQLHFARVDADSRREAELPIERAHRVRETDRFGGRDKGGEKTVARRVDLRAAVLEQKLADLDVVVREKITPGRVTDLHGEIGRAEGQETRWCGAHVRPSRASRRVLPVEPPSLRGRPA